MYAPGTRPYRGAWQETIAAAEQYNEPGRFTAFIGYEWTSNTGGNNLHRNVIFRDNGDKASQVEPFTGVSPLRSDNPADLWKWMEAYQNKTGGSVLAIAHNGNLSNGLMFPVVETFGKRVDREYAEQRTRWERLYEATQTKGDGEARSCSEPNDEFANFERWDFGNLDASVAKAGRCSNSSMPVGAEEWAQAREGAWGEPLQVRPCRQQRRLQVLPRWRRTTSSARLRRRSPAQSACSPPSSTTRQTLR